MGPPQFYIDSNGICFFCLKYDSDLEFNTECNERFYPFRNIFRYTKLDSDKFAASGPGSLVFAPLCYKCSEVWKEFDDLYSTFEEIKLRLKYSIEKINQKMKTAGEDALYMKQIRRLTKSSFMEDVRNELMDKCAEKLNYSSLQIRVLPLNKESKSKEGVSAVVLFGGKIISINSASSSPSVSVSNTTASSNPKKLTCQYCRSEFQKESREKSKAYENHLLTFHAEHYFPNLRLAGITENEFKMIIAGHLFQDLVVSGSKNCPICGFSIDLARKYSWMTEQHCKLHFISKHPDVLTEKLHQLQTDPDFLSKLRSSEARVCDCGLYLESKENWMSHKTRLCKPQLKPKQPSTVQPNLGPIISSTVTQEPQDDKCDVCCPHCDLQFKSGEWKANLEIHLIASHKEHYFPNLKNEHLSIEVFQLILEYVFAYFVSENKSESKAICRICGVAYQRSQRYNLNIHLVQMHHQVLKTKILQLQKDEKAITALTEKKIVPPQPRLSNTKLADSNTSKVLKTYSAISKAQSMGPIAKSIVTQSAPSTTPQNSNAKVACLRCGSIVKLMHIHIHQKTSCKSSSGSHLSHLTPNLPKAHCLKCGETLEIVDLQNHKKTCVGMLRESGSSETVSISPKQESYSNESFVEDEETLSIPSDIAPTETRLSLKRKLSEEDPIQVQVKCLKCSLYLEPSDFPDNGDVCYPCTTNHGRRQVVKAVSNTEVLCLDADDICEDVMLSEGENFDEKSDKDVKIDPPTTTATTVYLVDSD